MNSLQIGIAPDATQCFCQKWQITELALFGSVLRDDFRPDSDIDVLVTFTPDAPWTLLDLINMEYELADLTGRDIDLIEKQAIEKSDNWLRRDEILNTAQVIYSHTYVSA
ncbi:MAG: nucleotidyltransferase family protein [Cyanobacteria bacterium P01_A01_bin.135]